MTSGLAKVFMTSGAISYYAIIPLSCYHIIPLSYYPIILLFPKQLSAVGVLAAFLRDQWWVTGPCPSWRWLKVVRRDGKRWHLPLQTLREMVARELKHSKTQWIWHIFLPDAPRCSWPRWAKAQTNYNLLFGYNNNPFLDIIITSMPPRPKRAIGQVFRRKSR